MTTISALRAATETNADVCAHCGATLGGKAVKDEKGLGFCCDGCRAVYELIRGEGWAAFYTKRSGWNPGPVEKAEASAEYFSPYVKNLSDSLAEITLTVSGIRCAACVWLIENSASKDPGIRSIRLNYANHKAKVIFLPSKITLDGVLQKFTRFGYCPLPYGSEETDQERERRDYFLRFGIAAFFSMQIMVYSAALYAGYFQGMDEDFQKLFRLVSWALATPAVFWAGRPFFSNSLKALRQGHFTMDTLVALGSGSAYFYSVAAIFINSETYFDTASMIVTLILLGRFIEAGTKMKNGDAVRRLLALKPLKVKVIADYRSDGKIENAALIPIGQLRKGDCFITEKGEAFAADAVVESGEGEADESMLTGEAVPIVKRPGVRVYAGSKNLSGNIISRAEAVGEETFLSRIASGVEEAQMTKAPIQDAANKFVGKFVPFVISVAVLTFVGWFFIAGNAFPSAFMKAISVLVVACPCAMGLAAPLAITGACARLSSIGAIFKSGEGIERLAGAKDFYFDKTGTLTEGRMKVLKRLDVSGNDIMPEILQAAALSRHPASEAIASLKFFPRSDAAVFKEIPGKGIDATVNGKRVLIGAISLMKENGTVFNSDILKTGQEWKEEGYTVVYASCESKPAAVFALRDSARPETEEALNSLKKDGCRIAVLTGDNENAARKALDGAEIEIYANVTPIEKSEIIKRASPPDKSAMVGDGINDSVALASAAVGIAMGTGTDISIESAQIVLIRNDLRIIPRARRICAKTLRIIKENLFWAFSYNIVAIPLAAAGVIHPVMSAAFMSVSSLLVVTNSYRAGRE